MMKRYYIYFVLLILTSCKSGGDNHSDLNSMFASSTETVGDSIYCGGICDAPTITYELPVDSDCYHSSQDILNCFAWKNFIALNWNASEERGIPDKTISSSNYGKPGDFSPTVWESYFSIDDLFGMKNSIPTWGVKNRTNYVKYINEINKFSDITRTFSKPNLKSILGSNLDEIMQAEGAWLTDQNGNLVWYEIKINNVESNFISQNNLQSYKSLVEYATKNNGVWLPMESMELKAAWRVIPNDQLDDLQKYYKISKSMVPEVKGFDNNGKPIYGEYTTVYLGLVGLHIILKTEQSPQFIWMTFEHINNAPTEGDVDPSIQYCFYNPNSNAIPNKSPVPGKDPLNRPVQVTRIANNAITNDIKILNKQVQQLIKDSNPNSVWQYYQLVNVQWPENPILDSNNSKVVPLAEGGITPNNIANTTMETYIQNKQCMDCHKNASVVKTKLPTDYSFVFLKAKN